MGKKILIVRTSSLGDLVHMLPAMSDIVNMFGAIVGLSGRVWQIRMTGIRDVIRLRKSLRKTGGRRKRDLPCRLAKTAAARRTISSWICRRDEVGGLCAKPSQRHGLDRRSAREPLASFFYDVKHTVEFWQPAVTRQRTLASLALGYTYSGPPDFGLGKITDSAVPENYAVIMPSASRDDKLWPEEDWQLVFRHLNQRGLSLKLLSGNADETARAQKLVAGNPNAEVLPRMSLTDVAHVLASSSLMVGLDSGLTHLSAGLGRPTIGIYRASTPVRTPLEGSSYTASLGERGNPPSAQTVVSAIDQALEFSNKPSYTQNQELE